MGVEVGGAVSSESSCAAACMPERRSESVWARNLYHSVADIPSASASIVEKSLEDLSGAPGPQLACAGGRTAGVAAC